MVSTQTRFCVGDGGDRAAQIVAEKRTRLSVIMPCNRSKYLAYPFSLHSPSNALYHISAALAAVQPALRIHRIALVTFGVKSRVLSNYTLKNLVRYFSVSTLAVGSLYPMPHSQLLSPTRTVPYFASSPLHADFGTVRLCK